MDFVKQGALVGSAMLLMQQNPETNPRAKALRGKLSETMADAKHSPTMARMGAIMGTGIVDAGGRNVRVELMSRTGFTKPPAVVGMVLFAQYWYWYPMMHMLSLSFAPTALIGVNHELDMPTSFSVDCHEDLKRFFSALPHTAHPMAVLSSAVAALSTYYEGQTDPNNPEHVELNMIRMLAKLPVIAAYAHKKSVGQAFLYPDNSLSFVDNFLRLNFGTMAEPYEINPVLSQALERLLILHEDHEQNASTSTVRLVGSTQANLFASISAGINALSGPLHGGANESVLSMLGRIRDSGESVERFVERVKNKEDGVKLMGFGHRVYKSYDPRAKLVKESADAVLADLGMSDPLLDIARELEQIALADDYFIERKLYPNVDFYTGVIYKAMGFPTRMFTVLFAIGRLPGWIAHWREMNDDPRTKIGRPQQLYTGSAARDWPQR